MLLKNAPQGAAEWDHCKWNHWVNGEKLNEICQSQISLLHPIYVSSLLAYKYNLINVIT